MIWIVPPIPPDGFQIRHYSQVPALTTRIALNEFERHRRSKHPHR